MLTIVKLYMLSRLVCFKVKLFVIFNHLLLAGDSCDNAVATDGREKNGKCMERTLEKVRVQ